MFKLTAHRVSPFWLVVIGLRGKQIEAVLGKKQLLRTSNVLLH